MPRKRMEDGKGGISRRGFITSVSAGIVATTTLGRSQAAPPVEILSAEEMLPITLQVNGRTRKLLVEPRWTLAEVLRETLGLTGTKIGCGRGECGACTVLMDGRPKYSCLTLAVEAEGAGITTVEGLMEGEELGVVQKAFVEEDGYQCGFCTPGQVMAVEGLLRQNGNPSFDEIRMGVSGNLCRCGAYGNIFRAARRAADQRRG